MQKFYKEKRGFTLVEILIVVTILGILAAVVIVSVVGLLGKGQKESYLTDSDTIHTVVSAFHADPHAYSGVNGWNENSDISSINNYPIGNATDPDGTILDLYLDEAIFMNNFWVYPVMDANGTTDVVDDTPADYDAIRAAAIWMGLLNNRPGDGSSGPDVAPGDHNSPQNGEFGPYLSPLPDSCSTYNHSKGRGTYTWIMGDLGQVYGVFKDGDTWYAGFNGRYP